MPYKYVADFDDTDYTYSCHPSIYLKDTDSSKAYYTMYCLGDWSEQETTEDLRYHATYENLEEAMEEIEKFYKEAIEDYTERLDGLRKKGERLRELKEEAEQEENND